MPIKEATRQEISQELATSTPFSSGEIGQVLKDLNTIRDISLERTVKTLELIVNAAIAWQSSPMEVFEILYREDN